METLSPSINPEEYYYWIRLSTEPNIGLVTRQILLQRFQSAKAIFTADFSSMAALCGAQKARQLLSEASQSQSMYIEQALEWATLNNHHIVFPDHPLYPQTLSELEQPPTVLYIKGNPLILQDPCMAIVGSRKASMVGLKTAEHFAKTLSSTGWNIVSGLAAGVDTKAHEGALRGKGNTTAILGTGIGTVYPPQNRKLYQQIAEEGALVSEFPLHSAAAPFHFPQRNRIVAGLCKSVLVIEAGHKSGSLITAKIAANLGKPIFVTPGPIDSLHHKGSHQLIKDGAYLVDDIQDIFYTFGIPFPSFSPEESILRFFNLTPIEADIPNISKQLDLTEAETIQKIFVMEMEGKLQRLDDGKLQRTFF